MDGQGRASTGARSRGRGPKEKWTGRGHVGSYGALRPGCVGPEPWSGVFLGARVTGLLRGSMTCVQEEPINCVAGFPFRASENKHGARVRLRRSTCRPTRPGPPHRTALGAWPGRLRLAGHPWLELQAQCPSPFPPLPSPVVKVC